ncbi:MAG TPA: hypothetical protein PKE57_06520 [Cellvibrionaceae bacterium]|nr:hypothetical protein [Cellvibrionaceae bacterium]HMW48003.1 hypothetical protein [Cellvibrionaceae bacterium]
MARQGDALRKILNLIQGSHPVLYFPLAAVNAPLFLFAHHRQTLALNPKNSIPRRREGAGGVGINPC